MKISHSQLQTRQSWPLKKKVAWALRRIRIWHDYWDGNVHVQFSGGADSTALLHLVRTYYPDCPAVFCNTGLEFPEIVDFVKRTENVTILKPKMTFRKVIEMYGWPVISKDQACAISRYRNTKDPIQKHRRLHGWPGGKKGTISQKYQYLVNAPFKISDKCCDVMKKAPSDAYASSTGSKPYLGTTAMDSKPRKDIYLKTGCNAYHLQKPKSMPISVWTEDDVWKYIGAMKIPYSPIYDMGYERTGCVFCAFGVHMEKEPNRFQRLQISHPKLWRYCMEKLGLRDVLIYIGVPWRWKVK